MKRLSKAQVLGLNFFTKCVVTALVICFMIPFIVSFGGAYSSTTEYIKLITKACWIVLSRSIIVSAMPFIVFTFIKGLMK